MSNRSSQGVQGRDPHYMSELGTSVIQGVLCDLSFGHVLNGADKQGAPGNPLDQTSDRVDMLHLASRGDDAEDEVEIRSSKGAREPGVERREIISVDHVANRLDGDLRPWVDFEDPVQLWGPDVIVHDNVSRKVSSTTQPLGVGEAVVRPPEVYLGPFPILYRAF